MKIYILIFFVLINIYYSYSASSIDELFKLGNEKYKQGKYEEAIEFYESIIKKGIKNGYLFYNLGNAYFKTKQLGKAILNYERAKIYLPNDEDVEFNLKYASSLKVDKIQPPEYNPFTKVILFIYNLFDVNTLFILCYILLWLIIAIFIVRWLVKNILLKDIGLRIFPYVSITLAVLLIILIIKIYNAENLKYSIVLSKESEVRSGPGEDYTVIFTLHEGTKVRERNYSGNWIQITLPNGYNGWIKSSDIESIEK